MKATRGRSDLTGRAELVTGGPEGTVRIYDLPGTPDDTSQIEPMHTLRCDGVTAVARGAAATADGRLVAAAFDNNLVAIWRRA